MKKVLLVLSVLLIGCTTYQPITSTHPTHGYTIDTIQNEFELERLLRTDFKFRYDFAQFAMRQPLTWHWSNRISPYRFNTYNYWNPYNPMDYTQMWNDWLWGFNGWDSWGSPHRWSPFGYDRWGYGIHYGWNNHGWGYNGYYGNSWYWRTRMNTFAWQNRNRTNTVSVNGRRGSISNEVINNRRVRTNTNNNVRIRTNTKPNDDIRTLYPSGFINSNPTTRPNNVKPRVNNRPVINRSSTPRIIKPTTPKRGGN